MKPFLSHRDGRKRCEFFHPDEKGCWNCLLLQFSGQPVALVAQQGRIEWATSSAHHLLQRYWPQHHALALVPAKIRKWIIENRKGRQGTKKIVDSASRLVIRRPVGRLVIRILHDGTFSALAFEEFARQMPAEDLIGLGLTQREAEVLQWLAQGKTSHEIGTILNISSRTVSKHLKRVYQELGVENRHAAVAMAWEAVRSFGNTQGKSLAPL